MRTLRAYRVRTDRVGELVIARNSCLTYKGRVVDVKQVGRESGVRYVLEGSVRKAGNRTRVTAQLVEAETGKHVWANHYDRNLADIFAVQDEITQAVTIAVPNAQPDQSRLYPVHNPPAFPHQAVALAVWPLGVLFGDCWHTSSSPRPPGCSATAI